MKPVCPQGHNKLETGYTPEGKCRVCKRAQTTRWRKNNPDKVRGYHAAGMRKYRRTLRGFLDQKYTAMSKRVRGKDDRCAATSTGLPIIPRAQFLAWAYTQPELTGMFDRYREANWDFSLCPTVDRIKCSDGYVVENMRFLTQSANSRMQKGRPKNWRTGK